MCLLTYYRFSWRLRLVPSLFVFYVAAPGSHSVMMRRLYALYRLPYHCAVPILHIILRACLHVCILSLLLLVLVGDRGVTDSYMGCAPVEHLTSKWTYSVVFKSPQQSECQHAALPLYTFADETLSPSISLLVTIFGQVPDLYVQSVTASFCRYLSHYSASKCWHLHCGVLRYFWQ